MKIVILDGSALNPGDLSWECLSPFGEYDLYPKTESEKLAIQRIGDAPIVLTNKTPITRRILDACPSIRYIGVLATGYNVVDCDAAREKGIPVTNVPSYGTNAVAQFTFALLLEVCHQVGLHSEQVHNGAWVQSPSFSFWLTPQSELAGKTMGIIGYGRIGKAVGRLAEAFGMKVIASGRRTFSDDSAECAALDELLKQSDIVSLHCPLTPDTKELICADTIAKMKDGVILLNTSRGGLLNEQDVARALETGKLRAAALDVVTQEPMAANNPLLHAPNCIITPHIAWAPVESRQRLLDCVVDNLQSFVNGSLQNVVN